MTILLSFREKCQTQLCAKRAKWTHNKTIENAFFSAVPWYKWRARAGWARMRWWRWACCWSAGRSRPLSASVLAARWRLDSELQGGGGQQINNMG